MKDSERYEAALDYATEKHAGQKRIGGLPYVTHPMAVAEIVKESGYGIDFQIAALFHDLLEDTDATEEEILKLGGPQVLEAVKLVTKEKDYVMADYIARIKNNEMAFVVKAADRLHNLTTAKEAYPSFKKKYIKETKEWYWDFSEDIRLATMDLEDTL